MWWRAAGWTLLLTGFLWAQNTIRLEDGIAAMQEGKLREALDLFNRFKEREPLDARAYFLSGTVLLRLGQVNQAVADLEKAVQLEPDQPHFVLACAEVLIRAGDQFKAGAMLSRLTNDADLARLTPEQLWALSDLCFRSEDADGALTALNAYRKVREGDERIPFRMGQIHLAQNDLDQAQVAFEWGLASTRRKAEANYGLGLVLFKKGDLERARKPLEQSVSAAPLNGEFVHMLSLVLLGLEEADIALEHLLRVESQADQFPLIYDDLAKAYGQLGQLDKAREYRTRYAGIDKNARSEAEERQKIQSLLREGQQLLGDGRLEEARERFERVLGLDDDNFMAHSYLAGIFTRLGIWASVERHLARLDSLHPEAFETLFLRASYLYARGLIDQALVAAEKAKTVQSGFPELRNLLGNIHYARRDFSEAVREYEAAVELAPERTDFQGNLETARRRAAGQ